MERQTVYVDVLITVNFIADYFLIRGAQMLCHRKPDRKRILLGAFFGALFSLTLFLPSFTPGMELGCKIISSAMMMRAADRWDGCRRFFHGWAALFVVTILFGGAMLALRLSMGQGRLLCANGVVYFHISPLMLVGNITLIFGVLCLAQRFFHTHQPEDALYNVTIYRKGKAVICRGLVDTGNHLTEPFSGLPVVVTDEKTAWPLLDEEMQNSLGLEQPDASCYLTAGFRLIPYSGVDFSGVLPAVRGDRLTMRVGEQTLEAEQFYIAVSREPIGNGKYQILLSSDLMDTKREKVGAVLC